MIKFPRNNKNRIVLNDEEATTIIFKTLLQREIDHKSRETFTNLNLESKIETIINSMEYEKIIREKYLLENEINNEKFENLFKQKSNWEHNLIMKITDIEIYRIEQEIIEHHLHKKEKLENGILFGIFSEKNTEHAISLGFLNAADSDEEIISWTKVNKSVILISNFIYLHTLLSLGIHGNKNQKFIFPFVITSSASRTLAFICNKIFDSNFWRIKISVNGIEEVITPNYFDNHRVRQKSLEKFNVIDDIRYMIEFS